MSNEEVEDGDWREFKDSFDVKNVETYPIMVIALDFPSGVAYAKALGLKNYHVYTEVRFIQGARGRALVITPTYIADRVMYMQEMTEMWAGWQTISMTTSEGLGFVHEKND